MPWTPMQCGLDANMASTADTMIFVDVDGVLNVGARDDGGAPLMLNCDGIEDATKLWGKHEKHPMRDTIERLVSISRRPLDHGEDATFSKLASVGSSEVSDVLIGRLAELIRAAGERRMVVLSSRWKSHRKRVQRLEEVISLHLKAPFTFDAKTATDRLMTPEGRLESIGDFLAGLCEWRGKKGLRGKLRALVLEDFHINPMGGWSCGGALIPSVDAAERYLRQRLPPAADAETCSSGSEPMMLEVKLVHTYTEWKTPGGLRVQVGTGLTMKYFCEAARALGKGVPRRGLAAVPCPRSQPAV
mmetsp:Transcript_68128/g.221847  ORF Transcript_68128/g.221847 Transcript_68128/m.221847 type:complete len:302 (-) Transcript_68128:190-1095(-)